MNWVVNEKLSFPSERNLNPKAACLKRREEEKAEDNTPKLGGGHHLGHGQGPHMVQPPYHTMPPVSKSTSAHTNLLIFMS